jgi:predicted nucleic acid-binding protein
MAAVERTRVVVTDANVLINLIHVGRLDLLGSLSGYEFVVPPEVEAEVSIPEQAQALARAFDAGHIERLAFSGTAELEIYAELSSLIGKGEAACLAMAEVQGWTIASDERRRFLRLANERLGPGRVLNTAGLFVLAIRGGLVTVEEADQDKQVLEGHRFKMRFSSFRDVLGTETKE